MAYLVKFREILVHVCIGYAQVFFSRRWYVGLIFCAATFIVPEQGAAGLAGLVLSDIFALALGLSRDQVREGFFAFNGLLVGLALGLTYRASVPFVIMLVSASLLGVILASVLRALCDRYLFMPVLSAPFLVTTWIIMAAGQKFQGLIYTTSPFEMKLLTGVLPAPVEFVLKSLGSAFFQLSVPAGILVAAGLLIYSRQAFFLAVAGIVSGAFFHAALGGSPVDLQGHWIGFNFALAAVAVGGIFLVPGPGSYLLAMAAAMLSAVTAAGIGFVLTQLGVPVLASPFLFTTVIMLYALKNRTSPRRVHAPAVPEESPEANLKASKNQRKRFASADVPAFELPLSGTWCVTQGFGGEHTHRGLWGHAWDFEAKDDDGSTHRGPGEKAEDYYAWNKPVFAPADGKVVKVISHLDDNPVGQIDVKNNWGNTVVLWHYGLVYTSYSHLAKGSVEVSEGEVVRRGQIIGRVGNSGRSPFPHLHFQVQSGHTVGSPTIDSRLLNYAVLADGEWIYSTHGVPREGDVLQPLVMDTAMFDAASFPLGVAWEYKTSVRGRERTETWETEADFQGNRYLVCRKSGARLRLFVNGKVMIALSYEGPSDSGLLWLFLGLPRLPFGRTASAWREEMPPDRMLRPAARFLFSIFEPFFALARLGAESRFTAGEGEGFGVETVLSLGGLLAHRAAARTAVTTRFDRRRGLQSLSVMRGGAVIFTMNQKGNSHA